MFDYLKPYMGKKGIGENKFFPVSAQDIEEAEKRIGYKFPPQLRVFYEEIGDGSFQSNHDNSIVDDGCYANCILHPKESADIKLLGYDSGQILPSVKFAEDELPIFEIADGANFFVMKPQGDNPNAVYQFMEGGLIEDSFEKFIWRLYYESPLYYMKDWGKEAED